MYHSNGEPLGFGSGSRELLFGLVAEGHQRSDALDCTSLNRMRRESEWDGSDLLG